MAEQPNRVKGWKVRDGVGGSGGGGEKVQQSLTFTREADVRFLYERNHMRLF